VTAHRFALLSERGDDSREVQPIELFYDLVYVLAVTQLTAHLLAHLTLRGAFETLILLLAVWGAWVHIVWITNYFELRTRSARLVLMALTLASLVMSASIPEAFGGRGLAFACGLSASLLIGQGCVLAAVGRGHHLTAPFTRPLVWWSVISLVLIAGGLVEHDARLAVWSAAVALYYIVTWSGFPVPWLGRSQTTDYTIVGQHLAERCYLFITIALGESILVIGGRFGELPASFATIAAFVVAFLGSAALWWIYFDRGAAAAAEVISAASDPGRLGITAYTYVHIPMVAGIIVAAAGDEAAIAHPRHEVDAAHTALILGGPFLYLVGHALFKRTLWGYVPRYEAVAIVALLALVPVAIVSSALVLLFAATVVVVAVAWCATRAVG
jgi:low temperature requirement protein LtrA